MAPSIATTTDVDLDGLREFCRARHHVILVTRRRDGSPQTSPLSAGLDGQDRFVISTYPERAKVRNIRRDPAVSLLVLSSDWDGPWVQIDGEAEVLDMPEALDPLIDYFRSISGEHPDWEEYRQAMRRQDKSLVRVTPRRWGPVATGGFPAHLPH